MLGLAYKTNKTTYKCLLFLGIMAAIFVAPIPTWAAETLVNTETSDSQNYPAIARDSAGNFVITWHSLGQDGSSYGVFGQRFNSSGVAQGLEFQVNTYSTGQQGNASVAMDPDGGFVVAWQSEGQDSGVSWGVYAQRFLADGSPAGSEFQVNTTTPSQQAMPQVAMDSTGNFLIVWQGLGSDDNYGIHARRYDYSGSPLASEFLVHEITVAIESAPSIAMDPNGNFIVTWERDDTDGSGKGVYARRFNSSGVSQGAEFLVNTTTTNDQENPNIAVDQDGDFVIVWEDLGADGALEGAFGQRYNAAGASQGGEFQINTTTASNQQNPSVGMDPGGNFFVIWDSEAQDGDNLGVFGREYNYLGVAQGGEFQVNTTTAGVQTGGNNSVIGNSEGSWIIGWAGQGTGDTIGVFYDTFTSSESADLRLVKTVDDANPIEGGTVVYTLTISNLGPTD
ncbi:MAG: hypothetical protein KOO60_10445, partial [Gemmatimonadales bacterium]|nr:hypothetical protein [Gemmatimonadales bacterium]